MVFIQCVKRQITGLRSSLKTAKKINFLEGMIMKKIINKNTYKTVRKKLDSDDLIVTNNLKDDTADVRIFATDEEFKNASNYSLLNHFERHREE